MRVAMFGGTFDPPHRGHLAIAAAAADAFALDRVLFAPAGRQPLKSAANVSAFGDRLAMVVLACEDTGDPRFQASDLDAPQPDGGLSYTLRALTHLAALYPGATLLNLVGADSFRTLGQWREPQRLIDLAEWIVVSRPGSLLAEPEGLALTPAQRERIHLLDAVHLDISATMLRLRLAAGEACPDVLPVAVAEYIRSHKLYRGPYPRSPNPIP